MTLKAIKIKVASSNWKTMKSKKVNAATSTIAIEAPRKRRKLKSKIPDIADAPIIQINEDTTLLEAAVITIEQAKEPLENDLECEMQKRVVYAIINSTTTDQHTFTHDDSIDEEIIVPASSSLPGKYVALDCEMVGIGSSAKKSMLARVSLINYNGIVIYDTYVAPSQEVTDYRTKWSGITPELLKGAPEFKIVQEKVEALVNGRILIGHSIKFDLAALQIKHPFREIRDTATYLPHLELYAISLNEAPRTRAKAPPLRYLAAKILGKVIQADDFGHSSVEDAKTCMLLYKKVRQTWEADVKIGRLTGRSAEKLEVEKAAVEI